MKTLFKSSKAFHLLVFGTIAVLLGCGNPAEKVAEKTAEAIAEQATGQKVDIDQSAGTIEIKTEQGDYTVKTEFQTWPDDMPKEVPQIKEGKITSVVKSTAPEGASWTVYYEGLNVSTLESYETQLKRAGFKTALFKMDDGGSVSGEKGKVTVSCFFTGGTVVLTAFQAK
jgi:hypothetical protein